MRRTGELACAVAFGFALSACAQVVAGDAPRSAAPAVSDTIHPEIWPHVGSPVGRDPAIEAEVARLLALMTVEEKVGQIIQADVNSVTPEEVQRYRLGSILNGGNSGPYGNDRAPAQDWLKAADAFYDASMVAPPGRPAIPVIWGGDAVHGNANIVGATVFPHNIGLGATRDPDLVRKIGEITAIETRVIGSDWSFAPVLAVVRDDRWGRTYESYSESPDVVHVLGGALVEGLQGKPGSPDFLRGPHVISSAKHFLGDGGTDQGHDQGDNLASEERLRDIHAAGYTAAIAAGVQTVMGSYSSWHGQKMHGNRALLNDVLIERMGFDGAVIGDWNAHSQIAGCKADDCAAAFNAGIDMFMAPDTWRGLYEHTLAEVRSGTIPMARLNEAVTRILRVKLRAGLMGEGRPSSRPYAGQWAQLGSPEHRAVARQAVRQSLVLLKNEGHILPLKPRLHVLVAGDGANDIGKQCGGWTISWQGTGNTRADFPHAQSVFEGIEEHVKVAGGTAALSADGSFTKAPDVAIVVFGENPYAEFQGDLTTVNYRPGDRRDLALIRSLRGKGIPVIAVFLSGRPLYVTPEINASNAFVVAWLPGTEGGGIADMLFRTKNGGVAYDFRGTLSFSWPRAPDQTPLNVGDTNYDPLFAFGYGMTYATSHDLGHLAEPPGGEGVAVNLTRYIDAGGAVAPWKTSLTDATGAAVDVASAGNTAVGGLDVTRGRIDGKDAIVAAWSGSGRAGFAVSGSAIDLSRQTNGDMAVNLTVQVDQAPGGPIALGARCGAGCYGAVNIADLLRGAAGKGWTTIAVRLSCLREQGLDVSKISTPFEIRAAGKTTVAIASASLMPGVGTNVCPPTAR